MSTLYYMLESQVNALLALMMKDENGEVKYNTLIPGPKYVQIAITGLTLILFITFTMAFGLYLWNKGLSPVMPSIFARIDPANPTQSSNPYIQLFISLTAILLLL